MTDDQRTGKEQADALRESAPPSKKGDVSGHTERPTCPKCGKTFRVEVVVMLGWKDKERVDCPHCGTNDAYSESCWSLTAHK